MHTCYSPVRRSPARKASFPPAAPRLACVKPAASVHPEPGSNSSLYYFLLLIVCLCAPSSLLYFAPGLTSPSDLPALGRLTLFLASYSVLSLLLRLQYLNELLHRTSGPALTQRTPPSSAPDSGSRRPPVLPAPLSTRILPR